jgi:putative glycosyltransferase (TIGR04348 family)
MNIQIITPAPPGSQSGNRATAARWSALLSSSGHQVNINTAFRPTQPDLLIALHAWRSAEIIQEYKKHYPDLPICLVLTGTDIYKFQFSHPDIVYASMKLADRLIGLHHLVHKDIPSCFHHKLFTLIQSSDAQQVHSYRLPPSYGIEETAFTLCVIGHLREEKDPFRAVYAAKELPSTSKIKIIQVGRAHTDEWASQATREQTHCSRYRWLGEIPHQDIRALMAHSKLMVISSLMEGGANVVSEACRAELPILASHISGNIGLLGEDYQGYFEPQDHQSLAKLMQKAEASPLWLEGLKQHCIKMGMGMTPKTELASLQSVISSLSIE